MIRFYKNGKEFFEDNQKIIEENSLETSFFKLNSKFINSFNRRNYCFKVQKEASYLLVMRLDDFSLLLFGDKKLMKIAVDVICDYHLYFYGVLASKDLVEEFFTYLIKRRGGSSFIRHKMDMMYLEELKVSPTMNVVNATDEDYDKIVEFNLIFSKEVLGEEPYKPYILSKVKEELLSYYLLKVDNEIVSCAKITREDEKNAAISAVYTLPIHRNKGYSREVVSYISKLILDKGKIPYLYVDKENPISNHLYTKIGFKYGKSKYDVAYKHGNVDTLILAGGCFWCMAEPFYSIDGVQKVISGYCGGDELFPTYEMVKDHKTGHRESILIEYDNTKLSNKSLIETYFKHIDPFDDSGQFIDRGFNYTCAIFSDKDSTYYYYDKIIDRLKKESNKPIYVDFLNEQVFFKAEEYHQDYAIKNPTEMEEELKKSGRK